MAGLGYLTQSSWAWVGSPSPINRLGLRQQSMACHVIIFHLLSCGWNSWTGSPFVLVMFRFHKAVYLEACVVSYNNVFGTELSKSVYVSVYYKCHCMCFFNDRKFLSSMGSHHWSSNRLRLAVLLHIFNFLNIKNKDH